MTTTTNHRRQLPYGSTMRNALCGSMAWGHALCIGLLFIGGAAHAAEVQIVAMAGEPYGVGEISFPVDAADAMAWQCRSLGLEEADGRVLFPMLEHPGLFVRWAAKLDGESPMTPNRATIRFLFMGDQPLRLRLTHLPDTAFTTEPLVHRSARYRRMCRAWWNQIWGPLSHRLQDIARPRPVENYVAGLGMWQMGIDRHPTTPKTSVGTLDALLLGTARLRSEMSRLVSFDACCDQWADRPLPPEIVWRTAHVVGFEDVKVEDIAHHVPHNCFYLRFGKYSNLLWAMRLLESQGEELQRLVTLRGFHGRAGEKIQRQLAIEELPFADLIGDTLIGDVALIGRDAFVTEGAALGVLLRARNGVLKKGLEKVRREAVASLAEAGSAAEIVQIDGHDVSFISTPDNRLRSFHVIDGDWHLLTNSRVMAESFLRIGNGQTSLADLPAFRQTRQSMAAGPDDVLFAYFSTEFMKGMTTPAYLIELQRRLRAAAELQMLEVALHAVRVVNRASTASGRPEIAYVLDESLVPALQEARFLPTGFACRSDSSRPIWNRGKVIDSLRGDIGTFTPIADIGVTGATAEEIRVYHRFASMHANSWSSLDPIAAKVERISVPGKEGREQLKIDARVTPLQASNASILLGIFGQARRDRIQPLEEGLVSMEAIVSGTLTPTGNDARVQLTMLSSSDPIPPIYGTRLTDFLAIARQSNLRLIVQPGEAAFDRKMWQPATSGDEPYWYGPFDLLGRRLENYAAVALDQRLIDNLPQNVCFESQEEPAQAWLTIRELEGSAIAEAVTAVAAVRAMRGSLSNVQRFHQWSLLLGTELSDVVGVVESLVGARPVCPLGGEYALFPFPSGPRWQSTAWGAGSHRAHDLEDYHPALLRWWKGLDASFAVGPAGLRIQAVVDVEFDLGRNQKAALPSLPFFRGKPE